MVSNSARPAMKAASWVRLSSWSGSFLQPGTGSAGRRRFRGRAPAKTSIVFVFMARTYGRKKRETGLEAKSIVGPSR